MLWDLIVVVFLLLFFNWLSYSYFKNRILASKKWDLNICCGKTDGGGVNADVIKHKELTNFVLIKDIYHLPFKDKQFKSVLCSHTIEHVERPKEFFRELKRVGEDVTLVTPPLWDLWAVLNFVVHRWLVLSFRKVHETLPPMIPYPLGLLYDKIFGQLISA